MSFSGEPYSENKAQILIDRQAFKWVPVYLYGGKLRAYSIIVAKCPPAWGFGELEMVQMVMISSEIILLTNVLAGQSHKGYQAVWVYHYHWPCPISRTAAQPCHPCHRTYSKAPRW